MPIRSDVRAVGGCSGCRGDPLPPPFANPAVTLARAFTDTFAGIRLVDKPGFLMAQFLGGFAPTRGPGSKSAEIYFSVLYARSAPELRLPFPLRLYLSPDPRSP